MASFFSGWIGYGTGMQANLLLEPSDSAYVRRPIQFSVLESQGAFDVAGGTVGPALVAWGVLNYAGLFDAQVSGNLLLILPLLLPTAVNAGATYTSGPNSNVFVSIGSIGGLGTQSFPAGTTLGITPDGRPWITNIPVQVSAGVLSAQALTFGTTVTMGSLPGQQPTAGSGQLWNNGGVIAVS